MKQNVSRNIGLLYLIKVAKWFMIYMPISFLFYLENGHHEHYLLLHAIYSGVIAVFEVPSGYIADVWGRKKALVLGALFGTLGFGVYSVSYSFQGFLFAEILLGVGASLLSGADTAILYDTLKEKGKEQKYLQIEGRITAVGNISEALAGIFVSLIIFSFYRSYFVIQTGFTLIAFFAALFLIEPKRNKSRSKAGLQEIFQIVSVTFRKNKILRNFIYFSAIVGLASLSMAWLAQLIFNEVNLEEKYFGYAWVALNTMVALGSISAKRIDKVLGLKWSFIYMLLFLTVGFIFVSINLTYLVFIPMLILFYVRGTAHPILKNYINQNTDSSQRATVLSLRSLLIRILFLIMGPLLGFISNKFQLEYALYLCGIAVFVPGLVILLMILLAKKKNEN